MNRYLLDANACIAWLKNDESITRYIVLVGEGYIWLCTPVKAKLWFCAHKSQRVAKNQAQLRQFFAHSPSLPFDDAAAEHFGGIHAAIARARGLVVVTHNTREFTRIPDLDSGKLAS